MKNQTVRMLCHTLRIIALILTGMLAASSTAIADTLVAPGYLTNSDYALGSGNLIEASRYQQVYGADEFPPGVKLLITELRFRPDYQYGNAFTTTVSNVRIDLSTTSRSHDQLSLTFADNVGTNDTVVFSGPLSISSQFTGPANGPKAFDIVIPLQTPFLYDPALGNLLLDTRNFSSSAASRLGGTQPFDATSDTASRVANTHDANATSAGFADSDVIALQIVYSPVLSTLVVPGYLTNTDYALGSGNLVEPSRYQQVYGADEFPAGVQYLIKELRFRPDYQFGNAFTTTVSNIRIDLSTTTRSHDQLSIVFADNVGTNDTVVFSGPLSISSQFTGPTNGPKAFDIVVPLQTPFLYDPAVGNLLLDTRNFSGSVASRLGGTEPFDATWDTASRVANTDDASAANARFADSDVPALQIGYIPVILASAPPFITSQPVDQTVFAGDPVTFTVVAGGTPPLSYQWKYNGTGISGETNATLVLTNVQLAAAGSYSVQVTNAYGLTNSASAVLTVSTASALVVPGYLTNTDYALGSGNLVEPSRYQQVYGADEFPPGVKLLITELRFRPDYQYGNAFTTTVSNIRIDLSTTPRSHDQLSLTFADNVGTNDTVVFSGPLSISSQFTGPANGPKTFDIVVPLQTPFLYDPAAGNLLLDTRNFSSSVASRLGGTQPFDATWDTASRVANTDDANATSARFADSDVIALQVVYSPVLPAPAPPFIISQPVDQTVFAGDPVTFTVVAGGTPPLSYQWEYKGTGISGETNGTLVLTDVQLAAAGSYSVQVTNAYGSTNSVSAMLTVNAVGSCVTPPSGLVAWWRGEDSGDDWMGGNTATLEGGMAFAPGEVGQAFLLNGTSAYLHIPANSSLDVGQGNGLTVETWIDPYSVYGFHPIMEWNNLTRAIGVHLWLGQYPWDSGVLYANVVDVGGNSHTLRSVVGAVVANVFQHVALTYDRGSGLGTLYVNGEVVAQANLGSFNPLTSYDLWASRRPSDQPGDWTYNTYFSGLIDELSLYGRALSGGEVQTLYHAGHAGKCAGTSAPTIETQPVDQTLIVGDPVTFTVVAGGTPPLSYQWQYSGTGISGATNAALVLTNVQSAAAGSYSVQVTNAYGSTNSASAVLTVSTANALVVPGYLTNTDYALGSGNLMERSRYQQVYGANEFPAGIQYLIKELRFRPDYQFGNAFTTTVSNIRIDLSTTRRSHDQLSIVFADNVGTNDTLVFSGPLSISSQFTGPTNGPKAFDIVVPLQTPFLYDPAVGNLLLDTRNFSGSVASRLGGTEPFDATWDTASRVANTDDANATSARFADSDVVALQIAYTPVLPASAPPFISSQPQDQTVFAGDPATFMVVAGGTPPLSYQWSFNEVDIVGATNSTVTLTNAQPGDAGSYSVVVSNNYGTVISSNAVLAVSTSPPILPPTITGQPASQIVTPNSTVIFTVGFTGAGPYTFQWQFNGIDIAGATDSTLTLTNLSMAQAGLYRVLVGNGTGTTASADASLTLVNVDMCAGTYAGLRIAGPVGNRYRIDSQTESFGTNWANLSTVRLTSSPQIFFDSTWASSNRFYRAVLLP